MNPLTPALSRNRSTPTVIGEDAVVSSPDAPSSSPFSSAAFSEPVVRLEKVRVEFPFHTDAARGLRSVRSDMRDGAEAGGSELDSEAGAKFLKTGRKYVAAALDDIDLDVRKGDRLGLMGHNGAGKSTLIRVISGLLQPSSGRMITVGKVASTISTTFGFDMALSGRENVLRRGLMMRMSKAEIERHTHDIIEFAELGHYIDMPMQTYSSGMKARLGFAITTSADADILVMDEWIGAGDPRFIEKCEARLSELVDRSRILILATHKEKLLQRVCNRFAVLEKGHLREVGFEGGLEQHGIVNDDTRLAKSKEKTEKYRLIAHRHRERIEREKEKVERYRAMAEKRADKLSRERQKNADLKQEIKQLKVELDQNGSTMRPSA